MAYDFGDENWAAEVAEVSGDAAYQNCRIQIRNPKLLTVARDMMTGTTTVTGEPVVWEGQARIIGPRSALDLQGSTSENPSGTKSVRVQIPYGAYMDRIDRGWEIRVIDGGRNPNLENYKLYIESDFNSGNVASYTIECSIALDENPGWAPRDPVPGFVYPGQIFPGEPDA